jgi:hypothetical protein
MAAAGVWAGITVLGFILAKLPNARDARHPGFVRLGVAEE